MTNVKAHLAASVLNEKQTISYRLLSRQLNIHVCAAKRLLEEFHGQQNAKRPGSVHAIYVVDGTLRQPVKASQIDQGDDTPMPSSPPPTSSMPQEDAERESVTRTRNLVLVREADLAETLERFDDGYYKHIYSVSSTAIKNIQAVSECNRVVTREHLKEDPLIANRRYGVIQNPEVRRRSTRPPEEKSLPVKSATPAIKSMERKSAAQPEVKKSTSKSEVKKDAAQSDIKKDEATPQAPAAKPVEKAKAGPNPRRSQASKQPSSLMQAFSRSKSSLSDATAEPKAKSSPALTVKADKTKVMEAPAVQMDEDSEEDEATPAEHVENETSQAMRAEKAARAEALRRMMEDDDNESEESTRPAQNEKGIEDIEVKDAEASEAPEALSQLQPEVAQDSQRNRGRRKVMKKQTVKDDEGYLVTREEAVWESFSESERPEKPRPAPTTSKATKKPGAKTGQGNISSFFMKKS